MSMYGKVVHSPLFFVLQMHYLCNNLLEIQKLILHQFFKNSWLLILGMTDGGPLYQSLSKCLSVWVCKSYIRHYLNGTGLRCANLHKRLNVFCQLYYKGYAFLVFLYLRG